MYRNKNQFSSILLREVLVNYCCSECQKSSSWICLGESDVIDGYSLEDCCH